MCAIGQLQEAGVITATDDSKRYRVYCAKALLEILEEPARVVPEKLQPQSLH